MSVFVIDQVSWHTRVAGNPETRDHIIARFWSLVSFLQTKGLTNKVLAESIADIDDNFSLSSDDLTEQGLALMKKVYDKWLSKVDEGASVEDLTMFEKQLAKL